MLMRAPLRTIVAHRIPVPRLRKQEERRTRHATFLHCHTNAILSVITVRARGKVREGFEKGVQYRRKNKLQSIERYKNVALREGFEKGVQYRRKKKSQRY